MNTPETLTNDLDALLAEEYVPNANDIADVQTFAAEQLQTSTPQYKTEEVVKKTETVRKETVKSAQRIFTPAEKPYSNFSYAPSLAELAPSPAHHLDKHRQMMIQNLPMDRETKEALFGKIQAREWEGSIDWEAAQSRERTATVKKKYSPKRRGGIEL
jgi:hypothetical protein